MEFAVLAARVHTLGQIGQQRAIEVASRERGRQHAGIDAGEARAQAAVDHLAGQLSRRLRLPQGEERCQPGAGQAVLAVLANVLEKEIAEGDVRETVGFEAFDRIAHPRFVDLVRAWPRQIDGVERQAGGFGLSGDQRAADGVHGHAVERFVDGREQRGRAARMLGSEGVQRPRRVLAARPADDDLHVLRG